ncbi:MAG: hypothetical protein V1873_08890 [Verrucomicrobiota bacterium]
MRRALLSVVPIIALFSLALLSQPAPARQPASTVPAGSLFRTSDACMACHNGLTAPSGEDISIGFHWRSSMMANSARDPYWHAGVAREVRVHPQARAAIEHECSACHMPMTRYEAKVNGRLGEVFANLPISRAATPTAALAADGTSCTMCHQVTSEKLGTKESFTAGFVVQVAQPADWRHVFGPFLVDAGRARIMRSASGFQPTEMSHIRESELCATCHTLYTHALGPGGEPAGEFPEQVPYLEWRHSGYRAGKSCQACHMPVLDGEVAISSVLGQPRSGVSRHEFRGGNFLMPRMLNRFRQELGVVALPQELDATARRATEHLQSESAVLTIEGARLDGQRLHANVVVENAAGHKLPTAYPSRRAWLHFAVQDQNGRIVFESGAVGANGAIKGNDNDADATRYERHYAEIDAPGKVQIYEPIMTDHAGAVTTVLLSAVRYAKDNRLLPRGFDKATAEEDIAVRGEAATDADFVGGKDVVRYSVDISGGQGPFRVHSELCYQPIGYRWAQNLRTEKTAETDRFVSYYESMAGSSWLTLARSETTVGGKTASE